MKKLSLQKKRQQNKFVGASKGKYIGKSNPNTRKFKQVRFIEGD